MQVHKTIGLHVHKLSSFSTTFDPYQTKTARGVVMGLDGGEGGGGGGGPAGVVMVMVAMALSGVSSNS